MLPTLGTVVLAPRLILQATRRREALGLAELSFRSLQLRIVGMMWFAGIVGTGLFLVMVRTRLVGHH